MNEKLARKIDAYTEKHLAWWDLDEQGQPTEECKALDIYNWLSEAIGEDLDRELEREIRIECYKEALKADATFFDDANKGYCPDSMVEGWGDVYLIKTENGYFLKDCTSEPCALYEVKRA